jgi:uncharacterized sporulation protein YeaH/YhbH (DUF444 family)
MKPLDLSRTQPLITPSTPTRVSDPRDRPRQDPAEPAKYISQGELIGRQGKDVVSIPIPQIDIPRFRFGDKQQGGVGQGEGEARRPPRPATRSSPARARPAATQGDHSLEVDVTLDELAEILGEELELPDIQDKGKSDLQRPRPLLRHPPRRPRVAAPLQAHLPRGAQAHDRQRHVPPDTPRGRPGPRRQALPLVEDDHEPVANAVIIYMMDVSGSMGDEQKEIVRIESFWIDAWLTKQYKGLESRFIIHDAVAREVDRETFFHTRESGGTMISSAYKLCAQIIDDDYPAAEWNIYPFHFSDGDNWSMDDTLSVRRAPEEAAPPAVNMFAYGQVESPYGSGQFIKDLREHFAQGRPRGDQRDPRQGRHRREHQGLPRAR